MCGIAGFMRGEGQNAPGDHQLLHRMASAIAHRGPDGEGVWVGDGVGFAHRRLSVIDLSDAASQPMSTADGRHAITYNGEIYNYMEVRRALEALGETFVTNSDTEALLLGLRRWGVAALDRCNGMFAFAFWDKERRRLLLARDRIGKKPLYYAFVGGDFVFGSEIKALCLWPHLRRAPNYQAISHYLGLQYVPGPQTAFEGVFKLPPGHVLEIAPGRRAEPRRYWALPPPTDRPVDPKRDLPAEARDLLAQAVRRRLVADVPVGAFLSGGIDSSTTTALMALERKGSPIKTFSIGFEESDYDERRFARMVAQRYGADHHEEMVKEDAADLLPKLVWHYNEPFADSSAVPMFYLSRLARRHVTVALSGDGGDEFFLGYGRYAACMDYEWIGGIPKFVRRAAGLVAAKMPSFLARRRYFSGARRLLQLASDSAAARYEPTIAYFHDADKKDAYGATLAPYLEKSALRLLDSYFEESPNFLAGAAWTDIHTYLPDDIFVKVDVATMAYGLEARAPFVDKELMEWAAAIPSGAKVVNRELKYILKKAAEPLLPHDVIYRPKMGFGVPIDHWFRRNFATLARDTLMSKKALSRGLLRSDYIDRVLKEHASGERMHQTRLWAMLMLEMWFDMWIDREPALSESHARVLPRELGPAREERRAAIGA